jgi:hypothetical protein
MSEKRILDEETRKQLLGYTPFSSETVTLFTPKEFDAIKDSSLRPIFSIRSLNQAELIQLKNNAASITKDTTPEMLSEIANKNIEILKSCVKDWVQLYDSGTGEEISYSEENFLRLSIWIVSSIMEYVRKISCLEAPDELGLK